MEPKTKKPKLSPPSLYLNPTQQQTHERYFSKKIVISERYIDYESFPKYPIAQCFSGKNMIKSLLHIRGSAPIAPVLLFYSQIHNISEKEQSFDTYIEGKIHKITPQVIASLLGFENKYMPVSFPPASEDELVVSKYEFRRAVYLPQHVNSYGRHPTSEIKITHLKPIIAVLVRICQSNILPVLNHHSVTNLNSVYLSFLLLKGYQVDVSYIIWHTMAGVAPSCARTKSVPYGIIVGQLLSYLGHPFPADTPCASVPANIDVQFLSRRRLRCNPCDSNDRPLYEPDSDDISPPTPPPSMDADDASDNNDRSPPAPPPSMDADDASDSNQVNPICQECGDPGYVELIIFCNLCQTSAEHSYCLDKIPKNGDDEIIWTCEDCDQTAELKTRQGVQITSSKEVIEDSGTKLKY
ncbi:hypothetical protein MKW94_024192 [Papaver nudicaule]|uniref:PHD-type domain-containing protein n=1 Tax=Papaver nudicaule TaxID=74823 RepID=A0AA41VFB5_PAPNU|nr:hypothetical protein [Papaver nudicaule]